MLQVIFSLLIKHYVFVKIRFIHEIAMHQRCASTTKDKHGRAKSQWLFEPVCGLKHGALSLKERDKLSDLIKTNALALALPTAKH